MAHEQYFELNLDAAEGLILFCDAPEKSMNAMAAAPENIGYILKKVNESGGRFDGRLRLVNNRQELCWFHIAAQGVSKRENSWCRIRGTMENIQPQMEHEAKLVRLAQHDGITGLLNRSAAEEAVEACLGSGVPCVCVILDLDDFKQINDVYGHPVGDDVLRSTAELLRGVSAPDDIIGRLGGDEFLLLIQGRMDTLELSRRMEHLLRQVNALGNTLPVPGRISVSIGVAAASAGANFQELYRCADKALYCAKAHGKGSYMLDCWTSDQTLSPEPALRQF